MKEPAFDNSQVLVYRPRMYWPAFKNTYGLSNTSRGVMASASPALLTGRSTTLSQAAEEHERKKRVTISPASVIEIEILCRVLQLERQCNFEMEGVE